MSQLPERRRIIRTATLGRDAGIETRDVRDRTGAHWYCVVAASTTASTVLELQSWKDHSYYPGAPRVRFRKDTIVTYLPHVLPVDEGYDAVDNLECPALVLDQALRALRAIIHPQPNIHTAIFDSLLPAPTLRHLAAPSRLGVDGEIRVAELKSGRAFVARDFAMLAELGWHWPRRGDVLVFPTWHSLGAVDSSVGLPDLYLVVSSDQFNHRFPYPKVLLVPLVLALGDPEVIPHCVPVIPDPRQTGGSAVPRRYAVVDQLFTFDAALHLFETCPDCKWTWLFTAHVRGARCFRCKGIDNQVGALPIASDFRVAASTVDRVASAVAEYLELPEEDE